MPFEDDFCGEVAFFSSNIFMYMTGQNLVVNGGLGYGTSNQVIIVICEN